MLNTIILMGRLTADPDYRTTQSGVSLAKFTLAVERDYSSGSDGERATDFLDVAAWRQTADFVSKYFRKGQLVAVTGSVQAESYTDREGNKRRRWSIQASHCYFAEPKRDSQVQQGAYQPQNGYQQPRSGQNGYHNVNIPYEQQPPQNGFQQPYQGQQTMMGGYAPQPYPYQAGYQSGDFAPVDDGDLPF